MNGEANWAETGTYAEGPRLVTKALELARALDFKKSCIPEMGRLLRVLVAQAPAGTIGEIGTGCGVGAAWMLAGLRQDQRFVSIELDSEKQRAVSNLHGTLPNARFLHGNWRDILTHAPFSLLFVDVGEAKDAGAGDVVQSLAVGGLAVLDDFTPEEYWPLKWRGKPDTRRAFWLNDPRLLATEIRTTATTAAILAVRQG